MNVASLTFNLEMASKEYREAAELLERMKLGGLTVELSISHQYVDEKLNEGEKADLNALALAYCERRVALARERLVGLGMKPEALEVPI